MNDFDAFSAYLSLGCVILVLVLLIVTLIKVIRGSCHGFVVQMIVFLIVSNLATLLNQFAA
jgi:hypothetical protein